MFPCLKPKLALYLRCPSSLSASIPASTHTTLIFLLSTPNLPCPGTLPYPQGVSLSIPSDKFSLLQLSRSLEPHTLEVGRAIICCSKLRSCQGCTTRCLLEVTCIRSSPLPLELWVPLLGCADMKRTVPTPYRNGIQVSLLDGQGLRDVFIQNRSQGANLPRVGQTLGTWDPPFPCNPSSFKLFKQVGSSSWGHWHNRP